MCDVTQFEVSIKRSIYFKPPTFQGLSAVENQTEKKTEKTTTDRSNQDTVGAKLDWEFNFLLNNSNLSQSLLSSQWLPLLGLITTEWFCRFNQ